MQLQSFVTKVIEGIGGVCEPLEYALCQVLIPEEYKGYFQNKTELELAFDFEVAQENPSSEFVTFGSYILDQVLTITKEKAVSTVRFAEVERLSLGNPLKKITDYLQQINGKINILDEKHVMGAWGVYQFHTTFISDEKEVDSEQVWVNLITEEVSTDMKQNQYSIIYQSDRLYHYPIPTDINMDKAYQIAYDHVQRQAEWKQNQREQDPQLKKDLDRIESYYNELEKENDRKASRKGLSKDKINEIQAKSKAIRVEKLKQLEEIQKKYHGHTEISIEHGIIYFVPLIEYTIEILFRSERKQRTLYYNPITKSFDEATW